MGRRLLIASFDAPSASVWLKFRWAGTGSPHTCQTWCLWGGRQWEHPRGTRTDILPGECCSVLFSLALPVSIQPPYAGVPYVIISYSLLRETTVRLASPRSHHSIWFLGILSAHYHTGNGSRTYCQAVVEASKYSQWPLSWPFPA